jgi:hypothetical protein
MPVSWSLNQTHCFFLTQTSRVSPTAPALCPAAIHGTRGNAAPSSPPVAAAVSTCPAPPAARRRGVDAPPGRCGGCDLGLRILPSAPGGAGRAGDPPPQFRPARPPRRRFLRRALGGRGHRRRRHRRGPRFAAPAPRRLKEGRRIMGPRQHHPLRLRRAVRVCALFQCKMSMRHFR